jgi:hypothetical protein
MISMNYIDAIKEGRKRVVDSLKLLNQAGSPSYPLLFLKMDTEDFTPVGEENMFSVLEDKNRRAVVLCDKDGYAKAITSWMSTENAERVIRFLESLGLSNYKGSIKMPK